MIVWLVSGGFKRAEHENLNEPQGEWIREEADPDTSTSRRTPERIK
jgi:hypothetical protein